MFREYDKKFGFTLVEVITVCSMLAVMVIGIIFAINRAFVFINNTRLAVRATNLAREGVEMMYNIRDTNRRKYSGERDKHWLDTGTGSYMFGSGYDRRGGRFEDGKTYYSLSQTTGAVYATPIKISGQAPNRVSNKIDSCYEPDSFFGNDCDAIRDKSKLSFTGTYSFYSGSRIATGELSDLMNENGVEFYRVVRVYGIYCKNTYDPDMTYIEENGEIRNDEDCKNDSDPKELRFCVKVFYTYNGGYHASELCSIMTNFME